MFSFLYQNLFKPIAFRLDPEKVHDRILVVGKILGKFRWSRDATQTLFSFQSPLLEQELLGIKFRNPIGLSAGFDKNAELTDILPAVGFGFAEVGSITGEPCVGNPKKRLWRLPKSKSLVVNYGLKNDGAEVTARRLKNQHFAIPIGINIAKTNSPDTVPTQAGIDDYLKAHRALAQIGSYTTVNISCPNAFGGQPFTDPQSLELLLSALDTVKTTKPTFIKLSPDLSRAEVDELFTVIGRHNVQGIICSNLTKNRDNKNIVETELPESGGLSGKVVEELSNTLLAYVYKQTGGRYVVVGCGGVFSAEDAYKKIRLGASLVELITGMIYEGPQLIGEINRGLVKLLQRDGFKNISEAIGADNS